jgi:DNA-binding NarL/FixJ family response regulator
MNQRKITILVADDHILVRRGLVSLLSLNQIVEVIGEATDGRMALEIALQKEPDIVLMDIGMPVMNGLEATEQIRKQIPQVKVLILSAYDNEEYINQVINSGAMGYLLKNASPDELNEAIKAVNAGHAWFSPPISEYLRRRFLELHPGSLEGAADLNRRLTAREREIIQLLAEGKSHKDIADLLVISVRTVDTHTNNIMRKLDIHDTARLVTYAIKNGIVILPR